jgi:hypothetical protein
MSQNYFFPCNSRIQWVIYIYHIPCVFPYVIKRKLHVLCNIFKIRGPWFILLASPNLHLHEKHWINMINCFVHLITVYSRLSNFSAIRRLSPLSVYFELCLALIAWRSREGSFTCHTYCSMGPQFIWSHPKDPPSPLGLQCNHVTSMHTD